MHGNTGGARTLRQGRAAHREQLRGMASRAQTLHQEERLLLAAPPDLLKVRHQNAHAQAFPAWGHSRCGSWPPRTSRPSFRYFMRT